MTESAEQNRPRYPLNQSFVVQIDQGCEGAPSLQGRIEHVSSGEVLEFRTGEALLQFIGGILRSGPARPPPREA